MDTQDSKEKTTAKDSKILNKNIEQQRCGRHGITDYEAIYRDGMFVVRRCLACAKEAEQRANEEKKQQDAIDRGRQQEKINQRFANAAIAPRFAATTLDNYRAETSGQQEALEMARWFIANSNQSAGLIFLGKPSTGKNHLAVGIVKELIKNGKTALFTDLRKIDRAIKESWRKDGEAESVIMRRFVEPYLLVIDEVGVQRGTESELIHLTEIINDRYNAMLPTILIGNVDVNELKTLVGERVLERFKRADGKVVVFDWVPFRANTLKSPPENP